MSNPAPTPQAPATPPAAPEAPKDGETPPAKVLTTQELLEANRSKNAEAKNLRERLKAAEEERDSLRTAADALKPAEQLEAERIAALEADKSTLTEQLATLQRERLIAAVQKTTGLVDSLVDRLRGDTLEELTADAQALVAALTPAGAPPLTPNPGQGVPRALPDAKQAMAEQLFAGIL